jgi:hypothetical protein
VGERHEQIRIQLADRPPSGDLVLAVDEARHEADRERVDAGLLDESPRLALDLLDVHRCDHAAGVVDALFDAEDRVPRHQIGHVALYVVVELRKSRAASQPEGVGEALGDQHADDRTAQLRDRVGDDGRAVDEAQGALQQLAELESEPLGRHTHGLEQAAAEVVVGGQRLTALDPPVEGHCHIGVGAPDIHTDDAVHLLRASIHVTRAFM